MNLQGHIVSYLVFTVQASIYCPATCPSSRNDQMTAAITTKVAWLTCALCISWMTAFFVFTLRALLGIFWPEYSFLALVDYLPTYYELYKFGTLRYQEDNRYDADQLFHPFPAIYPAWIQVYCTESSVVCCLRTACLSVVSNEFCTQVN